jgi:hypothetical protein
MCRDDLSGYWEILRRYAVRDHRLDEENKMVAEKQHICSRRLQNRFEHKIRIAHEFGLA